MTRRILILIIIFWESTGYPTAEQKLKISMVISANIESTKLINDDVKHNQQNVESHATVKCEYIHPIEELSSAENSRACDTHCRLLTTEYTGGECKDGVCHCHRELGGVKRPWGADDPHPTVNCADLITEEEEEEEERSELCQLHCKTLKNGYKKGECVVGICFCSEQI